MTVERDNGYLAPRIVRRIPRPDATVRERIDALLKALDSE
jgi:hypothetical protein